MDTPINSRREFLKNMAIGGSAAFLASTPWIKVFAGDSVSKGAGDRVRIAFIGTGSRGQELLRNMIQVMKEDNIDICALCDNYQPHLNIAFEFCNKNGFSPKTYNDYRKLIEREKLDGVVIATPLFEHAHITIDCLNSGLNVFCEKAMARTVEDVKRMYDTHIKTNKILQIGHQRTFNPIYLEGMQRIHNGDIGKIGQIRAYWHRNNDWRRPLPNNDKSFDKQINWRLYKECSAGLLTELMSHQLQVATWALDQFPVSVMASGSIVYWKDGRTVPDNIAVIYNFPNEAKFLYDSMISNKKYGLEEQVMGDKGTVEFEMNRYYTETPPPAPGIGQLVNNIEHGIFDNIGVAGTSWVPETADQYKGERISPKDLYEDTKFELQAYAAFIRKGKAPDKMVKEAYYGSVWTLLAEKSIDTGQMVTLPEEFKI